LGRALDVLAGLIVGGVVWAILNVVLSFVPIVGWMMAAIIGGYIAGRLGGGVAAVILALFSPLIIASISGFIISLIPWGIARLIAGGAVGILITLMAVINLIFVGLGGYAGSKAYKSETCPYCGGRISKQALVCSSCGRELKPGVRPARLEVTTSEAYQTRLQHPIQPIEVEIPSEEKPPITEKKPSLIDQLMVERDETLVLLENLKKRLAEGKISEETYKELREEFEDKLKLIEEKLQKAKEEELAREREEIQKQLESLNKQLVEGRISEETYKELKKKYQSKLK
jgi:DNA-directed RNA polymerase subunit RPC12/RpoP